MFAAILVADFVHSLAHFADGFSGGLVANLGIEPVDPRSDQMNGRILLAGLLAVAAAGPATAALPLINATCPGGKEVHVDAGGPVFINGKQAVLKKINKNFYEANGQGIKLSISINPDGSATVSWNGRGRANGMCTVKDD